jgi:hypothetical protein
VSRIGVLAGSGNRDDVSRQLAALGAVEWHDLPGTLVARAISGDLDAIITGVRDDTGASIGATLVEIAAWRPELPIVIHVRPDRVSLGQLLAVFAPGLHVECVVRPYGRFAPVLQAMLAPNYRPGAAPLLLDCFLPNVPADLYVFVALAIIEAARRRSADELARWSGHSLRTIERRLQRAHWPLAHVVCRSFTALDAVWLMTEYGWSARLVQEVRAFPHASSVTRLLETYAGTRPSTVADDGGFAAALDRVRQRMIGQQS